MVSGTKFFPDPTRVAPHVQYGNNLPDRRLIAIVDCEREATGQCAMISAMNRVLSEIHPQPANIGDQRVAEVSTYTRFDPVVKINSVFEIGGCL